MGVNGLSIVFFAMSSLIVFSSSKPKNLMQEFWGYEFQGLLFICSGVFWVLCFFQTI